MPERTIKIIQIDGLVPRKARGFDGKSYDYKDERVVTVDDEGNESTSLFAVYDLPEDLAKMKLAGAPNRYKPFGTEDVDCHVPGTNSSMQWVKIEAVKFDLITKNIIDTKNGGFKKDRNQKPLIAKTNVLKDSSGKVVKATPYKIEEK